MSFFRRIFFPGEESEKRHVFLVLEACLCLTYWPFSGTVHPYIKECSADKFNAVWLNFFKRGNWGEKKRCRGCFFSHKHLNCLMFCFVSHWMWLKGNLLFFLSLPLFYFLWLYKMYAINSIAVSSVWPSDASAWMIRALDGSLIKFNKSVPLL